MERTTKIDRNDPNLFSYKLLFKCVPIGLKNVMHTKICIVLHLTPNMANITQKHGYTKMERLVLELDIIKYICMADTWHSYQGTCKTWNNAPPMYTSIMKLPLIWPIQVLWPLYKSYDLLTHFIKIFPIISHHLILKNISLDKSYDLSTYLIKFFWSNNSIS